MNLPDDYGLNGRRAIACGSTQGIGRACAMRFAQLGAEVTLIARDEAALKKVLQELPTDSGRKHRYVVADFSQPEQLKEKVAAYIQETGPIHVLLNNTGGPPHGAIVDVDPQAFLNAMRMHVVCNQILLQAVLPGMKSSSYVPIMNLCKYCCRCD